MSKSDIVYEILLKRIMSEDFNDGQLLSENILANELNISRTPIRSALLKLNMDGYIERVPNRGFIFKDVSEKERDDIFDTRMVLECFVLSKTIDILNQNDIHEMEEIIKKQKECYEKKVYNRLIEYDMKFHQVYIEKYHSEYIKNLLKNISNRLAFSGYRPIKKFFIGGHLIEEHINILDAIKKNDLERATYEIKYHMLNGQSNREEKLLKLNKSYKNLKEIMF